MILTGPEIERLMALGDIVIKPLLNKPGPSGADLTLSVTLKIRDDIIVNPKLKPNYETVEIPQGGFILYPGRVALGSTVEWVELHGYAGLVAGRSTFGRHGLLPVTAGYIDDGFRGQITLELVAMQPIVICAGDVVCQLIIQPVLGDRRPYSGRYQGQVGPTEPR